MLIKVEKNHINEGVQCSPQSCPIANAIRDMFKFETKIYVVHNYITINDKSYKTTRGMRKFITNFDKVRSSVKPTTFRLKDLQNG